MDEIVHQIDRQYKIFWDRMRKCDLDDDIIDYMLSRSLENMNIEEKDIFESTTLHIIPTWEMTRKATLQYLKSFNGTFSSIKPIYDSSSRFMKKYCIKELSYPKVSALCVGAVVMLLKNYIVEKGQ